MMDLFFFKKKGDEKEEVEQEREFLNLNVKSFPRYVVRNLHTSLGDAIDISKVGILISTKREYELGDIAKIDIDNKEYKAVVVRAERSITAFRLIEGFFPKEVIEKYRAKLIHIECEKKRMFSLQEAVVEERFERNKALINILIELDNPNTTIERFIDSIDEIDDLEEKILSRVNSILALRGNENTIESLSAAIAGLGFEELKRIVYNYIAYEVGSDFHKFATFENYDVYNMLLNRIFKSLSPLFSFNDIRSEGLSLVTTLSIVAVVLEREYDIFKKLYDDILKLYDFNMRITESCVCGCDLYEIGKECFVAKLCFFGHIYDGVILSQLMLSPHYVNRTKITISQRKLRFAYVNYLTILALKFILAKDKKSGYVLYQRLKRFGFSIEEANKWLNCIIDEINDKLAKTGSKVRVSKVDIPSDNDNIENYLTSTLYSSFFKLTLSRVKVEADRVAVRFDDELYTHFVIEKILNSELYGFKNMPFCVIPCESLEDDEVLLTIFDGFDIVIFKNIDKLPLHLLADFEKIWRDFDGKIICTYSNDALLEYTNEKLFDIINPFLLEFPNYFNDSVLYQKMLKVSCKNINKFFKKELCHIEDFKDKMYDMYSVYVKSLSKS
jgi:hypothetical protein